MMKIILMVLIMKIVFPLTYRDKSDTDRLIKIIEHIESKHNEKARNGKYVGILQISPIMVREANRINGYNKYSLSDRNDSLMNANIFKDIMQHHNKEKSIRKAVIIWRGRDNPNYRKKVIDMFILKKIECDKCTTR